MDRDLHSEQPNVGYLRTYRSKSDLAYSYTFAGHNIFFGSSYRKNYSSDDQECAGVLRSFILSSIVSDVVHGSSPIDSMLRTIATA